MGEGKNMRIMTTFKKPTLESRCHGEGPRRRLLPDLPILLAWQGCLRQGGRCSARAVESRLAGILQVQNKIESLIRARRFFFRQLREHRSNGGSGLSRKRKCIHELRNVHPS